MTPLSRKNIIISSAIIILLAAIWLAIGNSSSSEDKNQESTTHSNHRDTGQRTSNHSRPSNSEDDRNAANKELASLNTVQLHKKYRTLEGEFAKIEFLAQFEDTEPTTTQWRFLQEIGLTEESIDVVEALLISTDMSDNDSQARALFRKIKREHSDPDIQEFASDLLEER